jgi:transcriptional regulator with XRE-family HTH domain
MMQGSLAMRLRVLRAERGLSLTEAAERAGIQRQTLALLERGERHPHDPTLAKIAQGYGVPVEDLLEEPVPLAETPKEAGPANVRQLFAEHQARAAWQRAFDESRRFRAQAKMRLGEQLSLWEAAKHEGASYEERRKFLDATGRILDEASSVSRELIQNLGGLGGGLAGMRAEPGSGGTPNPYWTECQKADTLYYELFGMVDGKAGLSVHPKKTGQAPGQSDQALGQLRHEVLEPAA